MPYFVYLLATYKNGTLYAGSTNNLIRRVCEHKMMCIPSFTAYYDVTKLVYYEVFEEYGLAAQREKKLKKWKRDWKIALIEKDNLDWRDLFEEIAI